MANLTITVSNRINVFGGAPSDKWGQYNWNAFIWGDGTNDLVTDTNKLITNSLAPSSAVFKEPNKLIANSLVPDSAVFKETIKLIANSLVPDSAILKEVLKLIDNLIATDSAILKDFIKIIDDNVSVADGYLSDFIKVIANSLVSTGIVGSEYLLEPNGYAYVFVSDVSNAVNRTTTIYSSGSVGSAGWSSGAVTTTSWS